MEQTFDRIREGMEVRDSRGSKVGTVRQVFLPMGELLTLGYGDEPPYVQPYVQVDTRQSDLGEDVWVPADHVREITGEYLQLDVERQRILEMGWRRPEFVSEEL